MAFRIADDLTINIALKNLVNVIKYTLEKLVEIICLEKYIEVKYVFDFLKYVLACFVIVFMSEFVD